MSYAREVVKEGLDYTWVLTLQVERIAEAATRYHRAPAIMKQVSLSGLKGAIEVLIDLAEPLGRDGWLAEDREMLERAGSYREAMQVFRSVISKLERMGLVVRKSRIYREG